MEMMAAKRSTKCGTSEQQYKTIESLQLGQVVQKPISANPELNFNRKPRTD